MDEGLPGDEWKELVDSDGSAGASEMFQKEISISSCHRLAYERIIFQVVATHSVGQFIAIMTPMRNRGEIIESRDYDEDNFQWIRDYPVVSLFSFRYKQIGR